MKSETKAAEIKSVLVTMAENDKLPLDMTLLNESVFIPILDKQMEGNSYIGTFTNDNGVEFQLEITAPNAPKAFFLLIAKAIEEGKPYWGLNSIQSGAIKFHVGDIQSAILTLLRTY